MSLGNLDIEPNSTVEGFANRLHQAGEAKACAYVRSEHWKPMWRRKDYRFVPFALNPDKELSVADLIELVMQLFNWNGFVFSKDFVLGKSNSDKLTSRCWRTLYNNLHTFLLYLDSVEQREKSTWLESDGSDLSLTDKLKSWPGCGVTMMPKQEMYDTRKVGVDKVAMGKQFNGSYSEALKQAQEYISSKKYSVCCTRCLYKGLIRRYQCSWITKNDRCKSAEVRGLMDIEHSWRYATLLKLIWPPMKTITQLEPGSTIKT
jgi:hypothetical protein